MMLKDFIVIAVLLFLLTSCGKDEEDHAPNYELSFAELLTDHQGSAQTLVLDSGDSLAIRNPITSLRPDTVLRYIAVFIRETGGVRITSAAPAVSATPSRFQPAHIRTDSSEVQSIWKAGHYVNITLRLLSMNGRHTFAFVDQGITTHSDSSRVLHLLLYHNKGTDTEAFTRTAYLSCPLYKYAGTLKAGRDTIYFTINEWNKGMTTYHLLY